MGYGNTSLANREYDSFLAKKKDEKELIRRKKERREAARKDGSGWHFGIDSQPVKTRNMDEFRKELD